MKTNITSSNLNKSLYLEIIFSSKATFTWEEKCVLAVTLLFFSLMVRIHLFQSE